MTSEYEIRETLSNDSQVVIQRAVRRSDGTSLFLKRIAHDCPTPQEVRQLEFEHRILRKVEGPGVVRTLGYDASENEPVLLFEDFGGKAVALPSRGVGMKAFFQVARALAEALGHVHRHGVIHNDVRTSSVALNAETGETKLGRFGRASELLRERRDSSAAAIPAGSLPYTSPEQTGRMNREVDYRTDTYSLGVTLFELATGVLPFQAGDALGWAHCHISKRPPAASDVNPEIPAMVSEIIGKLLAKDPDDRYQSTRGLITDLDRCAREWQAGGRIETFILGAEDVAERFEVSRRLVGREREVGVLLGAFGQALRGEAPLLLVSGYSGVGKTSLISEVHRPIVERRGYFISGKFDQLDRSLPYAALAQAFRGLARQLLAEPEQSLQRWRRELEEALAPNQQLLVDLIPELQDIVGRGPTPAPLAGNEAQQRFKLVFRQLVKVVAREDHPLVLFLDDLQWADASTLDLLIDLPSSTGVGHLLVIGAYRDNEVHEGHPLTLALRELEARGVGMRELVLAPLDRGAVGRLVADTLRRTPAETEALTTVLYEKTGGNPLFISELLGAAYRQGLLAINHADGRWSGDPEAIAALSVTADVAALFVKRLEALGEGSAAIVKIAACVGHEFDLDTLATVAGLSADETAAALWDPIERGVIVPLDANYRLVGGHGRTSDTDFSVRYRFQHDRVQQAAYSLVKDAEHAAIHLKAGRLLRDGAGEAVLDERLFEIVNHLNLGRALMVDAAEQSSLARLNAVAGRKAKRSTAYPIALRYFTLAAELAAGLPPGSDGPDAVDVMRERGECAFLAGELELAERLGVELVGTGSTPLARAAAYSLQTMVLEHQGKLGDAIAAARKGLDLLGVTLPEDPAAIDREIGAGIGKMQGHLARVEVEALARLPEMTDPEKIQVMNLLFQVIPPAIQTYPPLFVLAELMMFDLALTSGTTAVSCKNFVDCGIIQGGVLGNYDVAYRLGQTAFELLKRYVPTPLESSVNFVFGAFVSHWRAHFREGLAAYQESRRRGLELGDLQHVAYACVHRLHRLFLVGSGLAQCEAEAESAVDYLTRIRAAGQLVGTVVTTRAVALLTGSEGSVEARQEADDKALATIEASKNPQWRFSYGQAQIMSHFLLGDLEAAGRWQSSTDPFVVAGPGLFAVPDYCLFKALQVTRPVRSPAEAAPALAEVAEARGKLAKWGEVAPANFRHKHLLLEAEVARLESKPLEDVLRAYDAAAAATGTDFIQLRALARELEAELCLDRGQPDLGRLFMREAHRLYARWGARAKLAALEARHPGWLSGEDAAAKPSAGGGGTLDLASVLKATQAISGEVKSEQLFSKLMDAIVENAGAQRGCLILAGDGDGKLFVEARSDVDRSGAAAAEREALDVAANVSREIVKYVARTREPLVLDDAAAEGAFRADPHVSGQQVRSALCMPVLRQGNLVGVLYVENNRIRGAFTKERLDVIRVIASQAAISIANARLYDSLEQKVAERTAELAMSRRQMQALLETVNGVPWEMDLGSLRFTYVGPQGERLLGYPPAEWASPRFFEERLHADDRARVLEAIRAALEKGQDQDLEFRMVSRDGRLVWVRDVLTVRDDAGSQVLRGMILDQTKRKQLEMELQQAQKLESVGRLASGIAHEINTPIQFVSDSVHFVRDAMGDLAQVVERYRQTRETLEKEPRFEEEVRGLREAEEEADLEYLLENIPPALERSIEGMSRVASIVRSMKEFAHPDQGSQAAADINKAVENTLVIARNEYKYVADVKLDLGDVPRVMCQVGELNQVVLNIVVNASHAIADVVRNSSAKGLISVRTWCEGADAIIAISDTGGGIPAAVRDRIFDPFFTTKEVGRGTGQGLAIARTAIVDGHGGTLTFETELGKGSTFFVRIPIAGKPSEKRSLAA